jgi:hypothetical protein
MQIRSIIRQEIQADQQSLMKKQMVLKEAIASEDRRRAEAVDRDFKNQTRSLPINIMKLIGSLKKAVRTTMRYKGGTPFSIIRDLFIYWDADKSGEISEQELLSCMNSLSVVISLRECKEVVDYYAGVSFFVWYANRCVALRATGLLASSENCLTCSGNCSASAEEFSQ